MEVERLFNRIPSIQPSESRFHRGKWSFSFKNERYEIDSTDNASRSMVGAYKDNFIAGVINTPIDTGVYYIKPSTCYAFKRAHAGVKLHTEKTLSDLIFLSKHFMGDEIKENKYEFLNSFEIILLKELKKEAEARDNERKKRINFNKLKEEFFKPAEHLRQYEHDKLHDVTCRWESPLYRDNLVDPAKALIDMKKFNERPLEYRLTMAQEEAVVIGIERYYLNNRRLNKQQTYRQGMTKLIADLSKGKFQNFMLDHIHLLAKPMWDYLEQFKEAEQNGVFSE